MLAVVKYSQIIEPTNSPLNKLKQFIKRNFESFTFYYRHLRHRIFLAVGLSIAVGILDGFGLAMFLPLLQMVGGAEEATGESMGNLEFLVEGLQSMGINLTLLNVLLVMIVFFFLKGGAVFLNAAYRTIIQQFFIKNLRQQLLRSFNHLKYKYFVTADVGRIQNTMSGEVERVSNSFQFYFRTAEQAVLIIVYMGFAFFIDVQFALLVTIGGWLTNFLYKFIYKRTKGASNKFTKDSHIYQGEIIQHVSNFKYLKATALLKEYGGRLNKSIEKIEFNRRYMGILNAILAAVREPLLIIVVAVVILIQANLLDSPLGPILISLLFFYRALTALVNMQNSWNKFLEMSGSLANVIEFQEEIKKNKELVGDKEFERLKKGLAIKNGYFTYDQELILKDITLTINKNETVAFVGESGSGKTTLVNILTGLMPLDEGRFEIDGKDSRNINLRDYQKRIGYITQEPVIFNDTVFNNVTFWDEPTSQNLQRMKEALYKAAILDFVEGLPEREQNRLGANGVNLSGGQRQRISIARELYKDIDILIMDEATSSLDTETELAIQNSLDELKGEYLMIIVAHRLSTVKNANSILVIKNGQIAEFGNYQELLAKSKVFRRMIQLQEI